LLEDYIIRLAPDSLISEENLPLNKELFQFSSMPISLDSIEGSFITFLEFQEENNTLLIGDMLGNLFQYDFLKNETTPIDHFDSAVISFVEKKNMSYTTTVGKLDPSEIPSGRIVATQNGISKSVGGILHRPVNTLAIDLNRDGRDELVVSEFGNLTGSLSLLVQNDNLQFKKQVLLNQPGTIRVLAKDMNKDGRDDLVVLTSQGDESITFLYQEDSLKFRAEKVIRFSPVYGTSWFELIDYDGDGYDDIITVNGDNADKSYIHKPYHGMRIHINDGTNNFEEKYFFSLNGATRLVAEDFDRDGDVDFGVLSTFPNYKSNPEYSFVYLENKNEKDFEFIPHTCKASELGRWFLMDAADIDSDGDVDIILSSFTYVFTPVPDSISQLWDEKNVDILLLENTLIDNKP